MLLCLFEYADVAEHGGESGVELVERGFVEGVVVHLLDDGGAAVEHFHMQVELEAVEMPPLSILILLPELVFFGAPFFQGFGGNVELFGGAGQIAVQLVDLIEGADFGIESIAAFHGRGPRDW